MMRKARFLLGWFLLILVSGLMLFAGLGKVFGFAPPQILEQLRAAGLGEKVRLIGVGEATAALLLLLPWTASIGILLTSAFWGGAILLHMSKGEPYVFQSILLILTWVGSWLRDPDVLWSFRRERAPKQTEVNV
jgi:hypothetical protein